MTERTEGWPAGLYLAALSLQAGAPSPARAETFTGDDRLVAEYFRFELLSRLPEAEARFLMHTSVLDRMCGGLCDAVLETRQSAQTLQSLERSNRFVVPLDRRGEWYRYHHLFGQLLRNELERTDPEAVAVLNRRAMAWCMANDLPEAAVRYGHAAGETAIVAGLVDRLALPLYYDGRMATVEEWLGWFDHDELVRYPALAVYGAWLRALTGRPAEAQPVAVAGRWSHLGDPPVGRQRHDRALGRQPARVHDAGRCRAGAGGRASGARGVRPGERLATERAGHSRRRPCAAGRHRPGEGRPGAAVDTGLASGAFEDAFVAHAELALLACTAGCLWSEAGRHARQAQAIVEETGLGDYGTSAIAACCGGRVALHEGRQSDARAALAGAHRLRPLLDHGLPWLTIQVGLELTRAHLALGEAAAARTVLTETERVLERRPDLGSLAKEAGELRERVAATSSPAGTWAMSLTGAELRLLPYLATHLTFVEIGQRLYLSQHTVKTEATSIYRKLQASSRSTAIERAVQVGLLESTIYPPRPNLT